ncbi:hypothetical protein HDE70_001150 [Pedobacter cryoconitis]|nr:hypothetical protein [Pedobacter cryoconitis]
MENITNFIRRLIKLGFKLDKIIIILIKTSHLQVKIYYIFL